MNSQFRNSNFGFILYTAIVTIMVLATSFVIWYMTIGYRVGTFGPETRLGSVYIGGLTEEDIIPLMDERIDYWLNDDTIVFRLQYQEYEYIFDRDLLLFDLELSTYSLKDGQTNTLVAYFQTDDVQRIRNEILALPYLDNIKDNININGLITDILTDASLMKSYSSKNVEDYIIDIELEIIELGSSHFSVPEGVQIDSVIAKINEKFADGKIIIPSKELFDISTLLSTELKDQELRMLSSAMLETILNTNFIINEVHYDPTIDFSVHSIDTYPYFGRNTVINRVVDESFSFYNPNVFTYYFTIEKIDEFNGELKLYGVPFEYTIEVNIQKTQIPFIIQATDDVELLQIGYNGVVVEVQRIITDIYGNEIKDDIIIFEFYPPIPEIIYEP